MAKLCLTRKGFACGVISYEFPDSGYVFETSWLLKQVAQQLSAKDKNGFIGRIG